MPFTLLEKHGGGAIGGTVLQGGILERSLSGM